jgi:hypothetical protein
MLGFNLVCFVKVMECTKNYATGAEGASTFLLEPFVHRQCYLSVNEGTCVRAIGLQV